MEATLVQHFAPLTSRQDFKASVSNILSTFTPSKRCYSGKSHAFSTTFCFDGESFCDFNLELVDVESSNSTARREPENLLLSMLSKISYRS